MSPNSSSILATLLTALIFIAHAETGPQAPPWPVSYEDRLVVVSSLIQWYGGVYGVSDEDQTKAFRTVKCENPDLDPNEQSSYIRKNGSREQSWGLSQIFLPAHPGITKKEAQDPSFSIDFLMKEVSKGNGDLWTCWRADDG